MIITFFFFSPPLEATAETGGASLTPVEHRTLLPASCCRKPLPTPAEENRAAHRLHCAECKAPKPKPFPEPNLTGPTETEAETGAGVALHVATPRHVEVDAAATIASAIVTNKTSQTLIQTKLFKLLYLSTGSLRVVLPCTLW